jgi:branched-chain amino acid transport system substrate-binding protein
MRIIPALLVLLSLTLVVPLAANSVTDDLYRQADSLYRTDNFESAANLFEQAADVADRGDEARFRFLAAKARYRDGDIQRAQNLFKELLRQDPAAYVRATSHYYLGNIEFESGNSLAAGYEYLDAWKADYRESRRDIYMQSLAPLLEYHLSLTESERLYNAANDRDLERDLFCSLAERYHREGECAELLDRIDNYLARHEDSPCEERLIQLQRFCRLGQISTARIALLAPQTGSLSAYGRSLVEGATLAFDEYRERTGAEIDLLVKDSEGTAVGAALAAAELDGEPLSAILGPLTSAEVPSVIAKAGCAGIPVLSPTASAGRLTDIDRNFFQLTPSLERLTEQLAHFAARNLGLDSIALIYPDDADGRQAAGTFLEVAQQNGADVFYSRSFSPAAADFRDLLIDLKVMLLPSDFDAELFIDKYGDTLETEAVTLNVPAICVLATQAQLELIIPQIHFYKIQTTFLGGDTWGATRILKMKELVGREVYFADNFFPLPSDRDYNYFYNRFESRFGRAPDEVAARSYDGARLLAKALTGGGPTPAAVMEYLQSAILENALAGKIEFDEQRENVAIHIYRALAGEVERVN